MGEPTVAGDVDVFDGIDVDTGDAPEEDAEGPVVDLTAEELAGVEASRAAAGGVEGG